MPEQMTTDVRTLLDREPFDASAVADLREVLGRDPSRYITLRDAASAIADREEGQMTPVTHLRLGIADCLLGRYRNAIDHLNHAGDLGLAQYFRGISYQYLQQWNHAAEAYEAAAKLGYEPKKSELKRIGAVKLSGRTEDARKLLDASAAKASPIAEYHYQLGSLLVADGDLKHAAESLEKAIELDRDHTDALFELAYINDLYGNDELALDYYKQCTQKPPVPVAAFINLGILYEDDNRYRDAEACYRRVLQSIPNHPRARLYSKDVLASKQMYVDEDSERFSDQMQKVMQVRSRNCLKKMNIRSLGDLTRTTEIQLLSSKNFGETSLSEIKDIMGAKGLRLGMALEGSERPAGGPVFQQPVYDDVTPEERALLSKPISELAFSVRARKCMQRLNINLVSDLVRRSGDELLETKNFGVTSLNEVRDRLTELGLKLKGD